MRTKMMLFATAISCWLPIAAHAAPNPCSGFASATRKAASAQNAKDRKVTSLEGKLSRKAEQFLNKQARYDDKIISARASADAEITKLGMCNPTAGFVSIIWDDPTATQSVCIGNSTFLGRLWGGLGAGLNCFATCLLSDDPVACQENCQDRQEKEAKKCESKVSSSCQKVVKYKAKADGYASMKVNYNPKCEGVSMTQCPSGILRNLYIQLWGTDGTGNTSGAKYEAKVAQAAAQAATAAQLCCESSSGANSIQGGQCLPKP